MDEVFMARGMLCKIVRLLTFFSRCERACKYSHRHSASHLVNELAAQMEKCGPSCRSSWSRSNRTHLWSLPGFVPMEIWLLHRIAGQGSCIQVLCTKIGSSWVICSCCRPIARMRSISLRIGRAHCVRWPVPWKASPATALAAHAMNHSQWSSCIWDLHVPMLHTPR